MAYGSLGIVEQGDGGGTFSIVPRPPATVVGPSVATPTPVAVTSMPASSPLTAPPPLAIVAPVQPALPAIAAQVSPPVGIPQVQSIPAEAVSGGVGGLPLAGIGLAVGLFLLLSTRHRARRR